MTIAGHYQEFLPQQCTTIASTSLAALECGLTPFQPPGLSKLQRKLTLGQLEGPSLPQDQAFGNKTQKKLVALEGKVISLSNEPSPPLPFLNNKL
jgi:hypothetical protein